MPEQKPASERGGAPQESSINKFPVDVVLILSSIITIITIITITIITIIIIITGFCSGSTLALA
jgi:hypothetical protein